MRDCHALDSPIECLDKTVYRAAALARIHGNHGNAREHVFDAVVKLRDQQALVLVSPLARGNVDGQALDAYTVPGCVELGRCCFLEPHFLAVGAHDAEGDRIRRAVGADTPHMRFEVRAVRRVNPRKKVTPGKGACGSYPRILAAFSLRWDEPVWASHSKAVTAPAVNASCNRAAPSLSAASCRRRSANSAARTSVQSDVVRMPAWALRMRSVIRRLGSPKYPMPKA